jgi:hypothetical protein
MRFRSSAVSPPSIQLWVLDGAAMVGLLEAVEFDRTLFIFLLLLLTFLLDCPVMARLDFGFTSNTSRQCSYP